MLILLVVTWVATCLMVSPSWLLMLRVLSSLPRASRFWAFQHPQVIFLVCLPNGWWERKKPSMKLNMWLEMWKPYMWLCCACITEYRDLAWGLLVVDQQVSFYGADCQQRASLWPQDEGHLISVPKEKVFTNHFSFLFCLTKRKIRNPLTLILNKWKYAFWSYLMPLSIWVVLLTLASQR